LGNAIAEVRWFVAIAVAEMDQVAVADRAMTKRVVVEPSSETLPAGELDAVGVLDRRRMLVGSPSRTAWKAGRAIALAQLMD
jgi:hypothetical protein